MARMEYGGFELIDNQLAKLDRGTVRRLVEAGAAKLVETVQDEIDKRHHIGKTGSMRENVKPGQYHETLDGGWIDVYPQGNDPRGISNAKKAFVINYGRGGKKTEKTGDKFITGQKRKYESAVNAAMEAENRKIIQEINGGN